MQYKSGQNKKETEAEKISKNIKIKLPEKVKYIIETIENAGFEAYAVGGCVRDSLLQRTPDDWDITTSAKPEQIKTLFPRTIDTGIRHGTVTVMLQREGFEVTTYRVDGEYEDSRHPKEVTFTSKLTEDLKRRDFTINAMAYNETQGLIDVFDGIGDIEKKRIRCVGRAAERFTEDALRIMRAIRFSAQLGYSIEEETKGAICQLASALKNISAERIQTELVKLAVSPHPEYLRLAFETGVTAVIFPEFDKMMETKQNNIHHCYSVGEHTLCSMQHIRPEKVLRLAMLFHDISKPDTRTTDESGVDHFYGHPELGEERTREILKRLKFDNDTVSKVTKLVKVHDYEIPPTLKGMRHAMHKVGEEPMSDLLEVKEADMLAQSQYRREEKAEHLKKLKELYREVLEKKDCVSLKTLAVTGNDLIACGIKPGREIGELLRKLLEMVIENPECNTKEYLLKKAAEIHPQI